MIYHYFGTICLAQAQVVFEISMANDKYSKINLNTEKILYYIFVSGGLIAASIIAPKLPYNLMMAYLKNKKFQGNRFRRDLGRLNARGDVWISQNSIKITRQGKSRILKYQLGDMKIKKPFRWDKKWRLVIFDIPDHQRKKSDSFRWKLYELGFLQYQKSIFIYPYPCQDEIDFIKEIYEITPYVKMILAEKIDDEKHYQRKFHLTK